ncbi:MAG: hypothetical protein FJZ01_28605, partial [Candidatus Sericytochromatia bacterium]|nr:hypothetical protein [Candidatus Tanganyikabacteria bacterium]
MAAARSVPAALLAAVLAATAAAPAFAQGWGESRNRTIAVRLPGVAASADPLAPQDPVGDFGSALAEPRHYLQVDHPLYRILVRRLEQVGRWELAPVEAPEALNTGNFLAFLRNAREKYGYKLQALAEKPDRTFRFKGELVKAGVISKLLGATYVLDPHWTTTYSPGSVAIKLVNRLYDVETGSRIAEHTESMTVAVSLAGLVDSMTEIEEADFASRLDFAGRKELQLGKEVFPSGSAQVQQAIGKAALGAADELARRTALRARDVKALELRGTITEVVGDQFRFNAGQVAGVPLDATFWVLKRSTRDGRTVEENAGFMKVRDVGRADSLGLPIAEHQAFSTGDAAAWHPMAGVAIAPRVLLNPLAFGAKTENAYTLVPLVPPSSFPAPLTVALPVDLALGPLTGSGLLTETYASLEPAFGLRGTAQDIIGLAGAKRRFYFRQLAVTPGLKVGVTFASQKLGSPEQDVKVLDPQDATVELATVPAETPITATRMGVSVGPEVAVDYQFHPNFSAGLHLDFPIGSECGWICPNPGLALVHGAIQPTASRQRSARVRS